MNWAARRLAGYYFAYFAYAGVTLPYFALYLDSRGYTAGQIAIVLAMPQAARIFAPAFWGWAADHWAAARGIVAFSGVALLAGCTALLWVEAPFSVTVVMLVMGALTAGGLPVVEAIAVGTLAATPGGYGHVRVWGSISFIAAVLLAGAWLDRHGGGATIQLMWWTAAATCVAAFHVPAPPPASMPRSAVAEGLASTLRRAEVLAFLAASALMVIAHAALYAFYSIHLDRAGYATTTIGALWTIGVIAEIVVFLYLPALTRRYSLRGLLQTSFLIAALRFALIGWGVSSPGVLVLAQLMHAVTFGVHHAASVALVQRVFGENLRARGQALYASLSYGVGGTLGTLLVGGAWTSLGPAWTFTLCSAFGLLGAAIVRRFVRPARDGTPVRQ